MAKANFQLCLYIIALKSGVKYLSLIFTILKFFIQNYKKMFVF